MIDLWGMVEGFSTMATIESKVEDLIKAGAKIRVDQQLRELDASLDLSALPDDLSYHTDRVAAYIGKNKREIMGETLFSQEEKREFIDGFFVRNSNTLPFKSDIEPILVRFLYQLEQLLLDQMSVGEKMIYRAVKQLEKDLSTLKEEHEEFHRSFTANTLYANSFRANLFLHKNNEKVTLTNLFVMPKYREFIHREEIKEQDLPELSIRLSQFIRQDKYPFLFIEGDAGSGKSTLVSWMNYHADCHDDVAKELLGGLPLVTIRLRDLDRQLIGNTNSLMEAILSYMRLCTIDNLEEEFPKAVIVLDGFDELCMIDRIKNYEELLYDLNRRRLPGHKYIITTRPKYVRLGRINITHKYISLKHFDKEKRCEWLHRYTNPEFCGQHIAPNVQRFIEQIDDDGTSAICDTPMTLYMLAAKKIDVDSDQNIWEFYHQIFYDEVSETEYNKMFKAANGNYAHRIVEHRDIVYQISEEIAYRMYTTGNSRLFLTSSELFDIVREINERNEDSIDMEKVEMQMLAERCYGLCSYWKADSQDGMIEFYHNNIRDFFLCEKIYRELNRVYNSWQGCSQDSWSKREINKLVSVVCRLFPFGPLETAVSKFLLFRTKYGKKYHKREFPFCEALVWSCLPVLFETLLTDGTVYDLKNSKNPIQHILNVLTCTAQVYRHCYEPFLDDGGRIKWWDSALNVNKNGMLAPAFHTIFCQVPVTFDDGSMLTMASCGDFSDIELQSCDLRNIGFQNSIIKKANFQNAILAGCDFSHTILAGSNFTNADIHYASLLDADLQQCILTGADLRGTDLPDDTCSVDQEEQITHLKALKICDITI